MIFTKKQIVGMEITGPIEDLGASAAKTMPPGRRHRYYQNAEYTVDDGSIIEFTFRGMTRQKLQTSIENTKSYVASRCITADYADGYYFGTVIAFNISGR